VNVIRDAAEEDGRGIELLADAGEIGMRLST
jgi:hypothetical protein